MFCVSKDTCQLPTDKPVGLLAGKAGEQMKTQFVLWDSTPFTKTKTGYIRLAFLERYGLCVIRNSPKYIMDKIESNVGEIEMLHSSKRFNYIAENFYKRRPMQGFFIIEGHFNQRRCHINGIIFDFYQTPARRPTDLSVG